MDSFVSLKDQIWFLRMCYHVSNVLHQQRIAAKPYVPATTYGRPTLGASGVQNKLFLVFLFSEHDVCVQFLKNVRPIPNSVVCCRFGSQMSWCVDKSVKGRWRCLRAISVTACHASISFRHGTWFQQSNLNFITSHTANKPLRCIQSLRYIWLGYVKLGLGYVSFNSVTFRFYFVTFRLLYFAQETLRFLSFYCLALRYVHRSSRHLQVLPHFALKPHLPFIQVLQQHISPSPL